MLLETKSRALERRGIFYVFHFKCTVKQLKYLSIKFVFALGQRVLMAFPFGFFVIIKSNQGQFSI